MHRSKGYALMFLLGAFLTGGALGFTADKVLDQDGRGHKRGAAAYRQKMAKELELTERQVAVVDSLFEAKHRQIEALYSPIRPQLDSIALIARAVSDSTNAQVSALLDSRQRPKFEKMRAAARKDLADRRRGDTARGGPPKLPR